MVLKIDSSVKLLITMASGYANNLGHRPVVPLINNMELNDIMLMRVNLLLIGCFEVIDLLFE
jgi:hypothetical protein